MTDKPVKNSLNLCIDTTKKRIGAEKVIVDELFICEETGQGNERLSNWKRNLI